MQPTPRYEEVERRILKHGFFSVHDDPEPGYPGGGFSYAGDNAEINWSPATSRCRIASGMMGVTPYQVLGMVIDRIRHIQDAYPGSPELKEAFELTQQASFALMNHRDEPEEIAVTLIESGEKEDGEIYPENETVPGFRPARDGEEGSPHQ